MESDLTWEPWALLVAKVCPKQKLALSRFTGFSSSRGLGFRAPKREFRGFTLSQLGQARRGLCVRVGYYLRLSSCFRVRHYGRLGPMPIAERAKKQRKQKLGPGSTPVLLTVH